MIFWKAFQVNTELVTLFGEPIKADEEVIALWSYDTEKGRSVELRIPISGPKASGILHVEAHRVVDEWEFVQFIVEIGEEEVDLSSTISR